MCDYLWEKSCPFTVEVDEIPKMAGELGFSTTKSTSDVIDLGRWRRYCAFYLTVNAWMVEVLNQVYQVLY